MGTLKHIKPGEPITADFLNEIATRLERAASLSVAQPGYLRMIDGPDGKHLVLAVPRPIWAKLSGSSSPYSFVEMQPDASGAWTTLGSRAGTNNAYEINGVAGLNNKIVLMRWTAAGDWRFNYRKFGGTAAPVGCNFCLSMTNLCGGAALVPDSAVLKSGSTVIATGTLGNQVTSVQLTAAGTGYSSGWHTLGFTGGGGTGAAGEFFVSGGHVTIIKVTANGSGYTSAPTVSFPGAGGSGAAGTAFVTNTACFQGIPSGSYTLVVSKSSFLDGGGSYNASACTSFTGTMAPNTRTLAVNVVTSCTGKPLSGATVDVKQGGVSIASGTTNSSGNVTFTGIPVNVSTTVTTSYSRFADDVQTFTITPGCSTSSLSVSMVPGSGYHCFCDCDIPCGETLSLTDSLYGTCTLNWTGSGWEGDHTVSYPGCCGGDCPPATVPLHYVFGCSSVTITTPSYIPGPLTCPTSPSLATGSFFVDFSDAGSNCPPGYSGVFDLHLDPNNTLYTTPPGGYTITISE